MRKLHYALLAGALMLGSSGAGAQKAGGLDAFSGRWQFDPAQSKMNREGPTGRNIVRDPTFTWQFTPIAGGLRMDVFTKYPQPAPTRTMTLIPDEKWRGCGTAGGCLTTGGDPNAQRYSYFRMDDHMLARLFTEGGKMVEYGTYAVSTDGKTLTVLSWNPTTPQYQNVQVFNRQ